MTLPPATIPPEPSPPSVPDLTPLGPPPGAGARTPRRGLGRGLDNLIPTGVVGVPGGFAGSGVRDLPVSWIVPNAQQPRSDFDEASLELLAESIRRYGVLQPIVVEPDGGERFRLLAGERRLRAARLAGLTRIPATIRPMGEDRVALEIALVENLVRHDLSALDEARAYARLCDEFGLTQEAVGDRVGRSRSAVANTMRLLHAIPEVHSAMTAGSISAAHARTLVALEDPDLQRQALRQVVDHQLSVRATERLVGQVRQRAAAPTTPRPAPDPRSLHELEEAFTRALGTRVSVHARSGGAGRIVIDYFTAEQLGGLCERLHVDL
ncbi:MAG TPA: ParB/RepB/Spo0J family partition protein [Verrucomicrobiae bacterium]|nr:ParB/RepB/Spo0J family partition protein [Verrucomicrobiae bacterium]